MTSTNSAETSQTPLTRRQVLSSGAASGFVLAAAAAAADPASGQEEHKHHDMEHMDHAAGGQEQNAHDHNAPAKHKALIDSAFACLNHGEICINHCLTTLSTGDTSLKDCMRSVSVMMPMCAALARAGALEASRLKDIAKVCIDICADCETECKKHAEHHAACKACGQSCADCIAECKKVI
ncbi:MAG: four-helix bundle copper-binding protein [Hyphomicrobium sp.]|jgi:Cys-rich four helix bundle protein (predicted Tat secretion target)|nr:four-helix bundle copper-binding protein [Hyphomicrobium sp.]